MTNILICDPSGRGLSSAASTELIVTLAAKPDDMHFDYCQPEEPAIDRVRSIYATKFLASGGDVLLFIDDDILYTPECVYQLVRDCLEKQSIVIGPYVKKTMPATELTLATLKEDTRLDIGKGGKIQEIKWGATGFMAIPRYVLIKLASMLPLCNEKDIPVHPFFCPIVANDPELGWIYLSEDFSFCERARQAGFKIWADTRIVLGHVGRFVYMIGQAQPEKVKVINK